MNSIPYVDIISYQSIHAGNQTLQALRILAENMRSMDLGWAGTWPLHHGSMEARKGGLVPVCGQMLAFQLGDRELVIEFGDGELQFYRIVAGHLEFRTYYSDWSVVDADDILQHVALETPVARWLQPRMRLVPRDSAMATNGDHLHAGV